MKNDAFSVDAFDHDGSEPLPDDGQPSEVLGLFAWLLQLRRQGSLTASSLANVWDPSAAVRTLGRFRLQGLLGTGAYGAVFRAFDPELGCSVALKLAWPAILLDPETSRRFIEEPKAVAGLTHPGIVRVYDSGQVEMARYISFELIDGSTLAEWLLRQEQPPARIAAALISAVAEAVDFAHKQGIVHRDLKPSNILLRPASDTTGEGVPQPVVTDFGLARRAGLSAHSDATATGAMIGTDRYMSPEQAAGQAGEAGPASDVFSLGVILYELIAGARPFDGETSEQVRERIRDADPPSIRTWHRSVPRDLETITLKCLEKLPGKRYTSAGELADDLQRFLNHEPIRARRTPVWRRAWKFSRRRPLAVSLCAAGLLASLTIASLLGAFVTERQAARERVALVQQAADASSAAAAIAEEKERQHQYATAIRYAARAHHLGNRHETLHHLEDARSLAHGSVQRGLEWELLSKMVNSEHCILPANPGSVRALRFSPDGEILISGGSNMQLTFWDTKSWEKVRSVFNKGLAIKAAEFSPDGAYLAVAGETGWVVIHRTADWSVAFEQRIFKSPVYSLAWMDGALVVGGRDAVLAIIDLKKGEVRRTAVLDPSATARALEPESPNEISNIVYASSRGLLAVLKLPPEVLLIDASSLSIVEAWDDPAAFPPHGKFMCYVPLKSHYLALVGMNRLLLLSLEDGKVAASASSSQMFESIRYAESTRMLVGCFRDGSVQAWNADDLVAGSDRPRHFRFAAHERRAMSCDISPDGRWLISGGQDGTLRLSENPLAGCSTESQMNAQPVSAQFSPCGRWLGLAERQSDGNGSISLFEVASGRKLWSTPRLVPLYPVSNPGATSQTSARYIAFDPTGDFVATCEQADQITVRTSASGQIAGNVHVTHLGAESVPFTPDGKTFVVRGLPVTRIIDAANGNAQILHDVEDIMGCYSTSQGELWIQTDSSRFLRLQRDVTSTPFRTLGPTQDRLATAIVSRDGTQLAAAEHGTRIYLWNLTIDRPEDHLIAGDYVTKLAFANDGQTLISQSVSGKLTFWHLPTKSEVLSIGSPSEQVLCMALHPEEHMLVLGIQRGEKYSLRVYHLGDEGQKLAASFEIND